MELVHRQFRNVCHTITEFWANSHGCHIFPSSTRLILGYGDIHAQQLNVVLRSAAGCLMESPVVAADGHTYEQEAIRHWFALGKVRSPMTNARLSSYQLFPNFDLRSAIVEWKERHRGYNG